MVHGSVPGMEMDHDLDGLPQYDYTMDTGSIAWATELSRITADPLGSAFSLPCDELFVGFC